MTTFFVANRTLRASPRRYVAAVQSSRRGSLDSHGNPDPAPTQHGTAHLALLGSAAPPNHAPATWLRCSECPQRDSNPRYSLERAVTWAASRWGPASRVLARRTRSASAAVARQTPTTYGSPVTKRPACVGRANAQVIPSLETLVLRGSWRGAWAAASSCRSGPRPARRTRGSRARRQLPARSRRGEATGLRGRLAPTGSQAAPAADYPSNRAVSSVGRAPGLHPGGRWFEPGTAHYAKTRIARGSRSQSCRRSSAWSAFWFSLGWRSVRPAARAATIKTVSDETVWRELDEPQRRQGGAWRWVGLVAAIAVYVVAALTFGLGLLLAPASLVLSIVGLRRLSRPRGWLPWFGIAANVALLLPFVIWVLPAMFSGGYFD